MHNGDVAVAMVNMEHAAGKGTLTISDIVCAGCSRAGSGMYGLLTEHTNLYSINYLFEIPQGCSAAPSSLPEATLSRLRALCVV